MNRFDFKPGLLTARTAMALNDIAAWIDRMERSRKGDSEFPTVERRRVKLTAHNGGTPPIYTGVEQSFTIAGVEEDKPNGESFSPTNQPIYERNGQTVSAAALTAGFHCWIDRRTLVDGVPTYEFDIGNPVAGSFTSQEVDGTPSTTTTLKFPNTSLTDNGDGTATVNSAGLTNAGLMSTGTQTLAGNKTFASSWVGIGSFTNIRESVGGGQRISSFGNDVVNDFLTSSASTGTASQNYTQINATDLTTNRNYDATIEAANNRFVIGRYGYGPACYSVYSGAPSYHDGMTGTALYGASVYGGIVTSAGSAITEFTDEAAQDAVGTILVDTATINLTYTDGTPSITADAIYQMSITADASGLKLSGDSATPGNDYYYGTNNVGTKGFYTIPIASVTDTATVDLTLTGSALSAAAITQLSITADGSGLKLDGDAGAPGNSYYYGTNAGGTKGFYTLPQAADVGALTDSTGGTANTTLVAIAGTGDDANVNDNFADLTAQVNLIRTNLRSAGIMA